MLLLNGELVATTSSGSDGISCLQHEREVMGLFFVTHWSGSLGILSLQAVVWSRTDNIATFLVFVHCVFVIAKKVLLNPLRGYLSNWPHYYRVIRSKWVFYNVLTTSINNTHIKWKNSTTICSSETISSRMSRCHLCDLVGLTSLWHSHRRVHSAGWTFTFFKPANCTHIPPRAT
jgi:hypothetical protein